MDLHVNKMILKYNENRNFTDESIASYKNFSFFVQVCLFYYSLKFHMYTNLILLGSYVHI